MIAGRAAARRPAARTAWTAALVVAALAAGEATAQPIVLSALGEAGGARLRGELGSAGLDAVVEGVADGALAGRLVAGPEPVVLVGFALPALDAVAPRLAAPRWPAALPRLPEIDRAQERSRLLFLDPIVLAWFDVTREVEADAPGPDWLPRRYEDLCYGNYENRLLLAAPRPWNASGLLLAQLALRHGGEAASEGRLAKLDANVIRPYLEQEDAPLVRLASADYGVVAVVLNSALRVSRAADDRYRAIEPEDGPLWLGRGAAVVAGREAEAAPILDVLARPGVQAALAQAAELVPARDGVEDDRLPSWTLPWRLSVEGEGPAIARMHDQVPAVVRRFEERVEGRMQRKKRIFDEFFDVFAILGIVLAIVWLLRRRERPPAEPPFDGRGPRDGAPGQENPPAEAKSPTTG